MIERVNGVCNNFMYFKLDVQRNPQICSICILKVFCEEHPFNFDKKYLKEEMNTFLGWAESL